MAENDFHKRLKARLEEAGRLDPGERFERMVKNGFINRRGELTKAHGGTAEPERTSASASYEPSKS